MAIYVNPASSEFIQDFARLLEQAGSVGSYHIVRDKEKRFGIEAKANILMRCGKSLISGTTYDMKQHAGSLDSIVKQKLELVAQVMRGSASEKLAHSQVLMKAHKMLAVVLDVCCYIVKRKTALLGSENEHVIEQKAWVKALTLSTNTRQQSCFEALLGLLSVSPFKLACELGQYKRAMQLYSDARPLVSFEDAGEHVVNLFPLVDEASSKEIGREALCQIASIGKLSSIATSKVFEYLKEACREKDEEAFVKIFSAVDVSQCEMQSALHLMLVQAAKARLLRIVDVLLSKNAYDPFTKQALLTMTFEQHDLEFAEVVARHLHPVSRDQLQKLEQLRAARSKRKRIALTHLHS